MQVNFRTEKIPGHRHHTGLRRAASTGLALALAGALAGCSRPAPDQAPEPPVLVPPEARQALPEQALEALDRNARRACSRAGAGRAASAGSADAEAVALAEPTGALATCAAAVAAREPALRTALFVASAPPDRPARAFPWAAPPAPTLAAPVAEVAAACGALIPAQGAALAAAGPCSPYLPGRRRLPALGPLLRLGLATAALAREAAHRGDPAGALRLLLGSLRLEQSLLQGGVPLRLSSALAIHLAYVGATLEGILASAPLAAPDLAAAEADLADLAATEPPLADALLAERLHRDVADFLQPLRGPAWVPPGGLPVDPATGQAVRPTEGPVQGAAREELFLAWLAARQDDLERISACSPPATPAACLGALAAAEERPRPSPSVVRGRMALLAPHLTDPARRARALEATVALLAELRQPTLHRPAAQLAARRFYLTAFRIAVAARRAAARGGPALGPRELAALPEARTDGLSSQAPGLRGLGETVFVTPALPKLLAPDDALVVIATPRPSGPDPGPPAGAAGRARDASARTAAPPPRTR
jgi:hypothetical protein